MSAMDGTGAGPSGGPPAKAGSGAEPAAARPPEPEARRAGGRRRLGVALAALLLLAAADLARPPERQLSARALLASIDLYQAALSPRLGALGVSCRFTPSCSRYAEGAIREDGALVGSLRAAGRIARCGPWTPPGTHDPP